MLAAIGRQCMYWGTQIVGVGSLFGQTIYWTFIGPWARHRGLRRAGTFEQMVFAGVRSLPIVCVVAFFTGVVLAMQSAYLLTRFGATLYVASLVGVSMVRELGPVLTSLVVAGRVGAAMTAELGTMRVTEQVEALEAMALHPVRFLVVPRFLALVVMLPCLVILANLVGIAGGLFIGVSNLRLTPGLYLDTTIQYLAIRDILSGVLKSVVFGMIIALISCYQGLRTSGGAEGVGRATTVSVVTSFILIILTDAMMTAIFYFSEI